MKNLPGKEFTVIAVDEVAQFIDADFGEMAPAPTNEAMAELTALVKEYETIAAWLEKNAQTVARGQKRLKDIIENAIPDVMQTKCGQEACTLPGGIKVQIKSDYFANIPAQSTIEKMKDEAEREVMQLRHDQAMSWIEENCPDIAKRKFEIMFSRDPEDQKLADKFERDLSKRKRPLPVLRSTTVHPQTLNATVRELIETGHQVPWDLLGVFEKKVAKISYKK